MNTKSNSPAGSGGWTNRLFASLRCWFSGHRWKSGRYEDLSTYAVCQRCDARREPIPRADGCTPVWDAHCNAMKCQHSDHAGARAWGGLCPKHSQTTPSPRTGEPETTMNTKLESDSPVRPATCSGFFIVNVYDRPSEEHIAERRADGKFYYVHPTLRREKKYWGMTPESPTPVENFGLLVDVKAGIFAGAVDECLPVTAQYRDGRLRKWQGSRAFTFSFQNDIDDESPPRGKL